MAKTRIRETARGARVGEPTKVNGPDGWRATLKLANDEAKQYLCAKQEVFCENAKLRSVIDAQARRIDELDEFGAIMIGVINKYQKEGR